MSENSVKSILWGRGHLKRVDIKAFDGFTLAEVLITLVIIGVIASMTIPTLMNNTNKQDYVSRLKKTYSTLAQATNRIIADEGTPKSAVGGWAGSHTDIFNHYKKYLSNAKECQVGQSCFSSIDYKYLNGADHTFDMMDLTTYGRLVLADGSFVNFLFDNANCNGGQQTDELNKVCAYLHVDINGAKGPNVFGRDAFRFYLSEYGLFPTNCDLNQTNCNGYNCACAVLRDGTMTY